MPLPISVVIPYRNASATFDEALASVRSQADAPAEIIVVDDASDDRERRHLESVSDGLTVVRFAKRRGPGPARNAGVGVASEPFVAFLDADDRWMPGKLRVQYRYMVAHPELDVTHTGSVVSLGGGLEFARVDHRPPELTLPLALSEPQMTTPSVMLRRSAFLRLGGFDPAFRCTQDWELQIRMVQAGYRVRFIPLPLTWVRREGHDHHSADWRCFLAGHIRVLLKHRRSYVRAWGHRGWAHRLASELDRGGRRRGGWFGRGLGLPLRLGV